MNWKIRKSLRDMTRIGFKYVVEQIKNYYPWLKDNKKNINEKIDKVQEEVSESLPKAKETLSDLLLCKYKKSKNEEKVKKERKQQQMRAIRNTIIGTTLGFGAGAAAGYVLTKKSQVKNCDYVFTDNKVLENTTFDQVEDTQSDDSENNVSTETKKYLEFDNGYQLSEDGTTLIKK